MIPNVRKTWAPRGCTPIVRHAYRRDRISAISAISVSPQRRRVGLYYLLRPYNLTAAEVCEFLRDLLRHLRGPVIVVWDQGAIHRGPRIRELLARNARLHLEPLPAYAPELNPDEGVWALAKATLANGRPADIRELDLAVRGALRSLRRSSAKLRGCILSTGLSLL